MNAPSKTWINPAVVVRLFTKTANSIAVADGQVDGLLKRRDFRVTAEAWRAALYLLAMSRIYKNRQYFLQHNPNDPPDFYFLELFTRNGFVNGYEGEIEVFQVPPESQLSVYDEVEKKIQKRYSSKTVLVCEVRNDLRATLEDVHAALTALQPNNEIWFIGASEKTAANEVLVAEVFPKIRPVAINIDEIVKSEPHPAFVEAGKGRASQIEYRYLGCKRLTPAFSLHPEPE